MPAKGLPGVTDGGSKHGSKVPGLSCIGLCPISCAMWPSLSHVNTTVEDLTGQQPNSSNTQEGTCWPGRAGKATAGEADGQMEASIKGSKVLWTKKGSQELRTSHIRHQSRRKKFNMLSHAGHRASCSRHPAPLHSV